MGGKGGQWALARARGYLRRDGSWTMALTETKGLFPSRVQSSADVEDSAEVTALIQTHVYVSAMQKHQ